MEHQREVTFSARGRMRLYVHGEVEKTVDAPAGTTFRVRITKSRPARIATRVQLAELAFDDREGLKRAQAEWAARGIAVQVQQLGSVYAIAGKVVDNRRHLLLLEGSFTPEQALQKQSELVRSYGVRTSLFDELEAPATGILELLDENGSVAAVGEDLIEAETPGGEPFDVRQVEYGVGYAFHGFQDRAFRGGLRFTVDRFGDLAVVNLVKLEELLKGLVPSEIFASAHLEALKAQAVTARGEVLAKIGQKHLADPYLLCAEQHCAVYKGLSGEAPSTNLAVEQTRGEALFGKDGRLVDSVYSAVCGGHTEDNDVVWGGPPDPNLRGRPDFISPTGKEPTPKELAKFLAAELPAACRLSTFSQPGKYRWERRFSQAEVDALTADLGVGHVMAMTVTERGVSGRARLLLISGDHGATQLRGELTIRRRFKMLNSAMFEISTERDGAGQITTWIFKGGGWGHGVGMCQTGAIGRAEAGQSYREILRHYFNGAEVSHIY
ncbi:MAG: SpoIID/LytB domain-containing protein [Myxococcaceae bacterium]|nr:SpoIID/LytB domain-containing protein [Myxococcaceae bacterium]